MYYGQTKVDWLTGFLLLFFVTGLYPDDDQNLWLLLGMIDSAESGY